MTSQASFDLIYAPEVKQHLQAIERKYHSLILERLILSYSPQFQSILNSAKQKIREGQGIGHEAFWEDVEKDIH